MKAMVEKPKRNSQIVRDLHNYTKQLEIDIETQRQMGQVATSCLLADIKEDIVDILSKQKGR